jgi:hypothetical protein
MPALVQHPPTVTVALPTEVARVLTGTSVGRQGAASVRRLSCDEQTSATAISQARGEGGDLAERLDVDGRL